MHDDDFSRVDNAVNGRYSKFIEYEDSIEVRGTLKLYRGDYINTHEHSSPEDFEVIDGHPTVRIGSDRHYADPGQRFSVPSQMCHGLRNDQQEPALIQFSRKQEEDRRLCDISAETGLRKYDFDTSDDQIRGVKREPGLGCAIVKGLGVVTVVLGAAVLISAILGVGTEEDD